jgi:two-component system chemotaxis response regulator CheY
MRPAVAKILTVDDAAFVRRWCAAVLSKAGHEVVEAEDGDAAVALFREHEPDLVLLDVLMPGKDGLAVLKEMRAHDPDARIVMLTTQGQLDTVREAKRLGARDFLLKPCAGDVLVSTVQRALA